MEEEKIQNTVVDSGMEKVDNALNRMLGKDKEAIERIQSLF